MKNLNPYAKSIIAALVAGLGSLQVANGDGRITLAEWIQIASVTGAALGFVWGVPNVPAPVAAVVKAVVADVAPVGPDAPTPPAV